MKISVVMPVFNNADAAASCLGSLVPQLSPDAEVIVVDNGSTGSLEDSIGRDCPGVRVLRNKSNEGAAQARNQGIEASQGEWILTLDCDVVLHEAFFEKILLEIEGAAPRTGMIQAKILGDRGGTIYSTGIVLSILRRFADRGRGQKDLGRYDAKKDIFGPCSAAAAYRRSMLDGVKDRHGYFDGRFFFLVEDVDLAWRARRAGWTAVFCPGAVCAHEGDSSKTGRLLRQYYSFRNRLWMLKKNEGFLGLCRLALLSPFYDAPRWLYLVLTNPYFTNPPHE